MQLEQNLYSIYQLVLKLPKYLFVAALLFLIFMATTQISYLSNSSIKVDLSQCMLDYIIKKNELKNQQQVNSTSANKTIEEYTLLDDNTMLNIEFSSTEGQCKFELNGLHQYNESRRPFMTLYSNEQLAYLYLKNKPEQYLNKHGILYHKLIVPKLKIEKPMLSFFFQLEMQLNQVMIESIKDSLLLLDKKFSMMKMMVDPNISLSFSELHLNFYTPIDATTHQQIKYNLLEYISIKAMHPIIIKLVSAIFYLFILVFISIFVGLFIRYSLIMIFSVFLLCYDTCLKENWGWMHIYLVIFYQRLRQNRLGTIKMLLLYAFSNIGMNALLTFGSYCIIKKIVMHMIPFHVESYIYFYLKTFIFIQLFHYIFCRSRTAIKYFPIFSFMANYMTIIVCAMRYFGSLLIVLNINLTVQLIVFIMFLLIQKEISEDNRKGFPGQFCPSMNKPRMLFYAGYDISWEKTLPPIWTYFTKWFDYGHFNEGEKCMIQKDYQLLYGRMQGLNQRQEIPEDDFDDEQMQRGNNDQPSNELNLIQNDL